MCLSKRKHEVCVVSLVPLGGKPKDTVELVFPYTPSPISFRTFNACRLHYNAVYGYRSINVKVIMLLKSHVALEKLKLPR